MMKILLVSVNASYMHTSLAVRCLKNYAEKNLSDEIKAAVEIEYGEYTINQPVGEVLRSIGFSGADAVLFSTYIWNAEYVCKILPDIKKVLPGCIVGAGGPEFGYGAEKYLKSLTALDFVMFGEGEVTFFDFVKKCEEKSVKSKVDSGPAAPECREKSVECKVDSGKFRDTVLRALSCVKGIFLRRGDGFVFYTGDQPLIEDLDEIPFPYPEVAAGLEQIKRGEKNTSFEPDHKIYYFESSRGCPFNCAYCLSSVDKRVRFKSLDETCRLLQIFLDANVALVKFVDRTYNLMPERYIEIWRYILAHHNGKTMFHFEIEAEYLSEEALEFLKNVPAGVMQFEMGVQSSNKKTLAAINRSTNVEKLAENIKRIPRTIHQHLDLIAGLPFEDLDSFGKSYDFVMALRPDALQLGFLKVLNGTVMEKYAKENNWQWMENPVYECFSTPYLSFKDVAFLKEIEILTDAYWNSGAFAYTLNYVFNKMSSWLFMTELHEYAVKKDAFVQARKETYWFDLMAAFIDERVRVWSTTAGVLKGWSGSGSAEHPTAKAGTPINPELLYDLLRYDFVRGGKKGSFPEWYDHRYDKEKHRQLLEKNDMLSNSRVGFALSEYEEFDWNVLSATPENEKSATALLIKYSRGKK